MQKLLTEMKKDNIIDNKLFHMFSSNIKPVCLYFLPKIHKTGNPGRSIISGNDMATEKILAFVDFHPTKYMTTTISLHSSKTPQNF